MRDFSQVFDAYAQFEESSLQLAFQTAAEKEDEESTLDSEMRMARFEHLMDRR